MSSCATQRQRAVSLCRERVSRQSPPDPGRFSATAQRNGCSGRACTTKVRRSARGACVARYYDPATGQFLSIDPAVAETDAPFNYAGDDPINEIDPSGLGGLLGSFSLFGYCVRYVTCSGSTPKAHIDQDIANVAAGVLNGITFGNGETIARWLGIECNANWNSVETTVGTIVGMGLDLGLGGEEDGAALLERLSASGAELDPVDAGGQLTRAGRALAKATEVFGPTSGAPAAINEAGQEALDDILTNPGTTVETMTGGRFAGGLKFVSPDGIGAVFSSDGTFQYFGRTSP